MSSVIPIWGNNPKEAFFRRKFQLPERFARAVVRIFVDTGFGCNAVSEGRRESGGRAWSQPLRTPGILV